MIIKVYKQRGEEKYNVVLLSETGRVVHKKFKSHKEVLKYTADLPIDRLTIEEV